MIPTISSRFKRGNFKGSRRESFVENIEEINENPSRIRNKMLVKNIHGANKVENKLLRDIFTNEKYAEVCKGEKAFLNVIRSNSAQRSEEYIKSIQGDPFAIQKMAIFSNKIPK